MTSRERVLAAINLKPVDRAPMDFGGTLMSVCLPEFLEDMRRTLGYPPPDDRDLNGSWVDERIQRYLNVDLRLVPPSVPLWALKEIDHDEYLRREKNNRYIRMADREIITYTVPTVFPLRDLSYEEIPEFFAKKPRQDAPDKHIDWFIETAKQYRADGYATTFWVSGGLFEVGCALRGYDQFCIDMIENPDIARLIVEKTMKERTQWINRIVPPLAPYIDIFCFGDDLSTQAGPFISPATYREMIFPYQDPIYRLMRKLAPDSYVFHHSCGSVYRLLPLLVEMGVSVINPTQVSAFEMEPERLKAFGEVCFHGGIDLQQVLSHLSPDEVAREVERVIGIMAPDGGYICAPCHSLPEDVPVENILAMFRADRRVK